jgi:hypothetical protein
MLSLRYVVLLLCKYDGFYLSLRLLIELVVAIDHQMWISADVVDLLSVNDKSKVIKRKK